MIISLKLYGPTGLLGRLSLGSFHMSLFMPKNLSYPLSLTSRLFVLVINLGWELVKLKNLDWLNFIPLMKYVKNIFTIKNLSNKNTKNSMIILYDPMDKNIDLCYLVVPKNLFLSNFISLSKIVFFQKLYIPFYRSWIEYHHCMFLQDHMQGLSWHLCLDICVIFLYQT